MDPISFFMISLTVSFYGAITKAVIDHEYVRPAREKYEYELQSNNEARKFLRESLNTQELLKQQYERLAKLLNCEQKLYILDLKLNSAIKSFNELNSRADILLGLFKNCDLYHNYHLRELNALKIKRECLKRFGWPKSIFERKDAEILKEIVYHQRMIKTWAPNEMYKEIYELLKMQEKLIKTRGQLIDEKERVLND